MENEIKKKITKSFFFYTIIYLALYIIIKWILAWNGQTYLKWINDLCICIIPIGLILGTIQQLKKKRPAQIWLALLLLLEIFFTFIILGVYTVLVDQEEIVEKDGKKMIKQTHSILFANWINYYDYKNPFYRSIQKRIVENYDDAIAESEYLYTIYYDENGKSMGEKHKDEVEKKTDTDNPIQESTNQIEEPLSELVSEILYQKIIDQKTRIVVKYKGAVLAQRSIIGIEKTTDDGKTWQEQSELQIHNGAEFVFMDEKVGFINDPGLAGTEGENRGLLVTTNGGRTFEEANIIHPNNIDEKNLFVKDVPYKEDKTLKVKIYTINYQKDPIKSYYEFTSDDEGKTWTYKSKIES